MTDQVCCLGLNCKKMLPRLKPNGEVSFIRKCKRCAARGNNYGRLHDQRASQRYRPSGIRAE